MAQHDYVISNGTGAAVRSDLNNALLAIVSNNSGATAPSPTYAYQLWADTTTNTLKLRNGANSSFITVGDLTAANLGLATVASPTFTGTATIPTLTVSSAANIPLGSAGSPTLYFTGDSNTGLYSPGADQVALSTGGTGRLFIDSSGRCGIGTSSPWSTFTVGSGGTANPAADASIHNASVNQYRLKLTSSAFNSDTSWLGLGFGYSDNYLKAGILAEAKDGNARANLHFCLNNSTTNANASLSDSRMVITYGGNVGIGTASPSEALTVGSGNAQITSGQLAVGVLGTSGLQFINNGTFGTVDSNPLVFRTVATERARLDTSGRLLVGTSSARDNFFNTSGFGGLLQVEGANSNATRTSSFTYGIADTAGPIITLAKHRSNSVGGNTVVASGDQLGGITFQGSDGSEFVIGAQISAEVDATPGANDMPGRLVFSTTADGASSPTERMRITQAGNVFINTQSALINESQISATGAGNTACFKSTVAGNQPLLLWNSDTSGVNNFVTFFTETTYTARGGIDYNRPSGLVRFNTTSDKRLKSEIASSPSALSKLSNIEVRSYKWTETDYLVEYGFIAQELNNVFPDAVKQGDDGDEIVNVWAVDNSKLVPLLTKALKEAISKIETLEARLTALESA